jgi:hypothetical protein
VKSQGLFWLSLILGLVLLINFATVTAANTVAVKVEVVPSTQVTVLEDGTTVVKSNVPIRLVTSTQEIIERPGIHSLKLHEIPVIYSTY